MSFLERYFCPGCNAGLASDNNGCPHCGYGVFHRNAPFPWEHIPPLSWWLTTTTMHDDEEMHDICIGFVRRLLDKIRRIEAAKTPEQAEMELRE